MTDKTNRQTVQTKGLERQNKPSTDRPERPERLTDRLRNRQID